MSLLLIQKRMDLTITGDGMVARLYHGAMIGTLRGLIPTHLLHCVCQSCNHLFNSQQVVLSLSHPVTIWYPMYYPEGMKAWVSPEQSIQPCRIILPHPFDLNQGPLGPQPRVLTTILGAVRQTKLSRNFIFTFQFK